jgi:hypothetical protein
MMSLWVHSAQVRLACLVGVAAAGVTAAWLSGCNDAETTNPVTAPSTGSTTASGSATSASGSGGASATVGAGGSGGATASTGGATTGSGGGTATSSSSGTGGEGPVGIIVDTAGHPVALAVDASGIYWSDSITGDVKKASLDGSSVITLAPAAVAPADFRGLALGKNDVYLAAALSPASVIRKVPKAGGAVTEAATTPKVTALTSLNGVPYWGESAGGSINTIGSTLIYGIWAPTTIAADPSGVYWTEATINAINRVSLDGSKVDSIAGMEPGAELGGVAGGLLYFAQGGTIHTVPMSGGAAPVDLVVNANPHFLTPTPKGLYWVEDAAAMLPRPVKGLAPGAVTPVDVGTATETSSLAVGQGYVYWASGVDGTISRAKEL